MEAASRAYVAIWWRGRAPTEQAEWALARCASLQELGLGGLAVGYFYLKRGGGAGLSQMGRFGVMAEIKYRYLKWKMGRLRKKFHIHPGRDDWDGRVH